MNVEEERANIFFKGIGTNTELLTDIPPNNLDKDTLWDFLGESLDGISMQVLESKWIGLCKSICQCQLKKNLNFNYSQTVGADEKECDQCEQKMIDAEWIVKNAALANSLLKSNQECIFDAPKISVLIHKHFDEITRILSASFDAASMHNKKPPTVLLREMKNSFSSASFEGTCADNQKWIDNKRNKTVIEWLFENLPRITRLEEATKLLPFMLNIAEDASTANRCLGIRLMGNYCRLVEAKVIMQMQLYHLFHQICKKNILYDDYLLESCTLSFMFTNLFPLVEINGDGDIFFEYIEGCLEALLTKFVFSTENQCSKVYLKYLYEIVSIFGVYCCLHLKRIFDVLNDASKNNALLDECQCLLIRLHQTCWMRIKGSYSEKIIEIADNLEGKDKTTKCGDEISKMKLFYLK